MKTDFCQKNRALNRNAYLSGRLLYLWNILKEGFHTIFFKDWQHTKQEEQHFFAIHERKFTCWWWVRKTHSFRRLASIFNLHIQFLH